MHFNGEIPDIPVVWNTRMTTTAGYCRYRRSAGQLRPMSRLTCPKSFFAIWILILSKVKRTLVHEMVHAYLCHKFNEKGHTPRFQRMMTDITGEHKNHRCHNYDIHGAEKKAGEKGSGCECGRCGFTYQKARMPKHAGYSQTIPIGDAVGRLPSAGLSRTKDSINIF